jgi:hypothetical protein
VKIPELRKALAAVLENNSRQCSVCVQNVDSGLLSFINLDGLHVSWGRKALKLFVPRKAAFTVPYKDIEFFSEHSGGKGMEIALAGRNLLSLRGYQAKPEEA